MSRLIDADNLKNALSNSERWIVKRENFVNVGFSYDQVMFAIDKRPTVDAVPVVRCKDCIYFQQKQVRTYEGTYRNKFPNEGMVSIDVGINIGSHCKRVVDVREEGFRDGEPTIERTYLWRNEDDFCSRGKRKTDATP